MLLIKMYICKHKEISLSWIFYTTYIYVYIEISFYSTLSLFLMQCKHRHREKEQNRLNPIYKTTISCKIKVP